MKQLDELLLKILGLEFAKKNEVFPLLVILIVRNFCYKSLHIS